MSAPPASTVISPNRPGHLFSSGPRVFAIAFLVFFGASAIWSAAVPLLGGPDEPSQMVKAAAVARGEWTALCYDQVPSGACVPAPGSAKGMVVLPSFYAMIRAADITVPRSYGIEHSQICFHSHVNLPASCARTLDRSPDAVDIKYAYNRFAWSYSDRYPPLYYFLVGQPSHFGGSTIDLYLMRLVSAALSAIFLALAVAAAVAYSQNRLLVVGLVLAISPMVLFLGGVVNPSSLEVASAIAFFTAGTIVVSERIDHPPVGLLGIVGVSAAVFESTRSLSPFWLLADAAVLLASAPGRHVLRLLRDRSVQFVGVAVAVVGAAALCWILIEHATDVVPVITSPLKASDASILSAELFRSIDKWAPAMVGIFGWYDAFSPTLTFLIWFVLVGLLFFAALRGGSGRQRLTLVVFLAAIVVLPVAISSPHARVDGYLWSGRDTMPFAMGLPIVAASVLGSSPFGARAIEVVRRFLPWIVALAAVAQFGGFFEALRRWSVGSDGPFTYFLHPHWQPAIHVLPALLLEVAALLAMALLFWASFRSGSAPPIESPGERLPDRGDEMPIAVGVGHASAS